MMLNKPADRNSLPLPAYTHIPGVTPHPTSDPRGHSFGCEHITCATPDWISLPGCELFQHGCRLFNAGYYWEAHEAWEGVWIAAGRTGLVADFVKGLIKLAAAGVKLREGELEGVQRHLRRAEELFFLTASRLMLKVEGDSTPAIDSSTDELTGLQEGCDLLRLLDLTQRLKHQLPAIPDPNAGRPIMLLGAL